jgi:ubiquitin carboxyl-terminal hydrolase 14
MIPVSRRLKEIEKERTERRKVRKRTKASSGGPNADVNSSKGGDRDSEMADISTSVSGGSANATVSTAAAGGSTTEGDGDEKGKVPGELEDEGVYLAKEVKELEALVDPGVKSDIGCSVSGLYDLVGK